jgi:hypothetical protein
VTLNTRHEQATLARGDPGDTPRRRAEAHGLTLHDYLAAVYDYEPKPPADASGPGRVLQARKRAPTPLQAALRRALERRAS